MMELCFFVLILLIIIIIVICGIFGKDTLFITIKSSMTILRRLTKTDTSEVYVFKSYTWFFLFIVLFIKKYLFTNLTEWPEFKIKQNLWYSSHDKNSLCRKEILLASFSTKDWHFRGLNFSFILSFFQLVLLFWNHAGFHLHFC